MHTATTHHTDTHADPADDEPILSHQFDDVDQQSEASTLGMWLFLATEVMFFGGLLDGLRGLPRDRPRGDRAGQQTSQRPARLLQYGRPPGQQPDHGPGRPCRPVAGTARAGQVAGADHGPRVRLPRDQGGRVDQRLPRAPDPGVELPGPRERPVRWSSRKDWIRERWSCSSSFTSS